MRTAIIALALFAACTKDITKAPTGHVSGLSTHHNDVVAAARATEEIYRDPAFRALVERRVWLAQPDAKTAISGAEVVRALAGTHPARNEYVLADIGWGRVPFKEGGTFAETTSCWRPNDGQCGKIVLNKKKFPRGSNQPTVINTVAHENTHTLGTGTGACGCGGPQPAGTRFTDGGYTDATKAWLVSYALGDLAQCWVTENGDAEKALSCLDTILDGVRANRRVIECCPSRDDNAGVLDARTLTPYCQTIVCPPADR